MYARIIAPLDGSKLAEHVLPYVRFLGKGLQARVELLRALDSVPQDLPSAEMRSHVQNYLENVAASLRKDGLIASFTMREGNVASGIVTKAAKEPGTLIVMSTHGRSGMTRWVLGSITDKVLRATTDPVMVVRPHGYQEFAPEVKLETVIVPLDGSYLAEQVLPHVVGLTKVFALTVNLVRVTPSMDDYSADTGYSSDFYENLCGQADAEAIAYLRKTGKKLSQEGIPAVEERLLHGHPVVAIGDVARQIPNSLVAMTTRGHSGVGRWGLGSVTDKVVRHSGSAVLVVRGTRQRQEHQVIP